MIALGNRIRLLSGGKSLLGRSLIVLTTQMVRAFGALIVGLIIANAFTTAEFGDFRFFQISLSLLATVAAPGFVILATSYFAKFEDGEPEKLPPLAHLGIISLIGGVFVSLVCFFLPGEYKLVPGGFMRLPFALAVLVVSASYFSNGGLMGLGLFARVLFLELLALAVMLSGVMLAAGLGDVTLALWSIVLSYSLVWVLGIIMLLKRIGLDTVRQSLNNHHWSSGVAEVASSLGPLSLYGILASALFWGTGWVLREAPDGAQAFALYTIGLQWFLVANMVPDVITRVAFPRMVQQVDADQEKASPLLLYCLIAGLITTVLIFLAALVLSPFILALYGPQYTGAPYLIALFTAVAIPFGLHNILGCGIVAWGGEVRWALITFIQFLVALVVAFFLVGQIESAGGWALLISAICAMMLSAISVIHKSTGLRERHDK